MNTGIQVGPLDQELTKVENVTKELDDSVSVFNAVEDKRKKLEETNQINEE